MLSTIIAIGLYPLSLIISFANKYNSDDFKKEFLSKRQTTVLKGMMIMIVFFYHFTLIRPNADLIGAVYGMGQICLTIFFFISGYTTCLGHMKAQRINLKKIWITRAWRLYLPLLIFTLSQNNFFDRFAGILYFDRHCLFGL